MAYSLAVSQAISILLYIALNKIENCEPEFLSTRVISENLNIPAPTATKVLKSLNMAGLTTTREGAKGGIILSRNPSKITLLDVFKAMEQERPLFKCELNFNISGELIDGYKDNIKNSLSGAESAMKDSLKSIYLSDLM